MLSTLLQRETMKANKIGFTQGVVYAVALLLRTCHEGAAETLWKESGFTKQDLNICDAYDADKVREYFDNQ